MKLLAYMPEMLRLKKSLTSFNREFDKLILPVGYRMTASGFYL